MPKQKNRPKNKPKPEIGEIEDKPKRHGPRWLMGKNDKFGMNDLFRLYQQYGGMQQEDQGEGNTIYEDDVNYYGPPPGTPGAGTYVGDQSGIAGMPGMPALPAAPQTASQAPYAQQAGQLQEGDPWANFWPEAQAQQQAQPLSTDPRANAHMSTTPEAMKAAANAPAAPASQPIAGVPQDQVALARKYGAEYGVDPNLLLAIGKHETGFGELGLGKKGLTLGYGAFDSGETMKWAGHDNQYRAGAERLQDWGVKGIDDIMAGKAASWATDPKWEAGIQNAYQALAGQLNPVATAAQKPMGTIDEILAGIEKGTVDPKILDTLGPGLSDLADTTGKLAESVPPTPEEDEDE